MERLSYARMLLVVSPIFGVVSITAAISWSTKRCLDCHQEIPASPSDVPSHYAMGISCRSRCLWNDNQSQQYLPTISETVMRGLPRVVFSLCVGGAAALLLFYVLYFRVRFAQLLPRHGTGAPFQFGLGRFVNFELSIQTVNFVSAAVGTAMAISLGAVASVTLEIHFQMHLFLAAMYFGSNGVYLTLVTWLLLYRLYDQFSSTYGDDAPLHVLRWKIGIWLFLFACYFVTPVAAVIIIASAPDPLEAFNGAAFANMLCVAEYATVIGTLCWITSLLDDLQRIELHLHTREEAGLYHRTLDDEGSTAKADPLLHMDEDSEKQGSVYLDAEEGESYVYDTP
jgi:hypothetical protein